MSYMNDDCDPFGVPYDTSPEKVKSEPDYSFKDLEKLYVKKLELEKELKKVASNKEKGIKQLKKKLKHYVSGYAEINCDNHMNWEIITSTFEINELEKLKEDFNLRDIKVECCKVKKLGHYEERIKIRLFY